MSVTSTLESSPLPMVIANFGRAIMEAQRDMDLLGFEILQAMSDASKGIALEQGGRRYSLLELGFEPSFYHFTDAKIDARLSISMTTEHKVGVGAEVVVPIKMVAVGIGAGYSGKYSYKAEAATSVSTRLVSVPAPDPLKVEINKIRAAKAAGEGR